MTIEEIKSNIRYNEDLIDQYIQEKRILERKIEDCDLLKSKYNSFQNEFGNRQQQRQTRLNTFLSSTIQNKIVGRFFDGMKNMLDGKDFRNAYDGLTEAKQVIGRKIAELERELDNCRDNLAYRRRRLEYWQEELELALSEEEV